MRKNFIDPPGKRYCRKCEVLKPLDKNNYFVKESGFMIYCKVCDKAERKRRYESKESHNIKRRCKECGDFFWAELAKVNKGLSVFCGASCRMKHLRSNIPNTQIGENNSKAKLTEKIVKAIRKAVKDGKRNEEIMNEYNISSSHLCNIISGRIWKDVL